METSFLKVRRVKLKDENILTDTSFEQVRWTSVHFYFIYCARNRLISYFQAKVEDIVEELFSLFNKTAALDASFPKLNRKEHLKFLKQGLFYLPQVHSVNIFSYLVGISDDIAWFLI